jgi:hypothetical protein
MSPHRVWFWQDGRFRFLDDVQRNVVSRDSPVTDAVASGGSWVVESEDPLVIHFMPGWCQWVRMRDCRRSTFPDGTIEVQSNNAEVQW